MTKAIQFFYDFVSPYSYFAFSQREEISNRTGRQIELRPVSVGMVMDRVGNVPTSITCKAKRAYQGQDVARWAGKLKVPLALHPRFGTFSTAPLIQSALASGKDLEAFSQAAFEAVWVDQAPVEDDEAMAAYFAQKGPRLADHWRSRDSQSDALVQRVDEAANAGVFGVPYFHTDIGDFFGNDRLEFLFEAMTA